MIFTMDFLVIVDTTAVLRVRLDTFDMLLLDDRPLGSHITAIIDQVNSALVLIDNNSMFSAPVSAKGTNAEKEVCARMCVIFDMCVMYEA